MRVQRENDDDSSIGEIEGGISGICGCWSGILGRLLLAFGSMILAVEIEMRFCSYNGVGFDLAPHVEGEMSEITKKTML